MAMKDWKKTKANEWVKLLSRNPMYSKKYIIISKYKPNIWTFNIILKLKTKGYHRNSVGFREFYTKPQALSFAKTYMKSH